jgi:hypothetical protein
VEIEIDWDAPCPLMTREELEAARDEQLAIIAELEDRNSAEQLGLSFELYDRLYNRRDVTAHEAWAIYLSEHAEKAALDPDTIARLRAEGWTGMDTGTFRRLLATGMDRCHFASLLKHLGLYAVTKG